MVWIDNARIVSIFAVVLLHVAAIILSENRIGTEYWWIGNIFSTLVRWCVPVFVMISGALLLDFKKQERLSKFYSKRLSRILIPILFWSLFFSFWTFLSGFVEGKPPTYFTLISNILRGLPYEHLWFLYMIWGLYLFVPFLRIILKYSKKEEIKILIISTFVIVSINFFHMSFHASAGPISSMTGPVLFVNRFLMYIPFFLIGYFIRGDNNRSKVILWIIFSISSLLTLIGYYFVLKKGYSTGDAYFHGYLSISVILMSISVMYLMKTWNTPIFKKNFNKQLSSLSFGIYLIHPIILEILNKTRYIRIVHPVISIPSATIAIFLMSFVVASIFYKTPYLNRVI